jgi:hypothetical protein
MLLNPSQYSPQGLMPQFAGPNPYLQSALQNPFQQSQYQQSPLSVNPYLQNQLPTGQFAANPLLASSGFVGGPHLAQHVGHILGQLAQHNFAQSELTQQIGATIQHLAQIVQMLQSQQSQYPGQGFQAFGSAGQSFGQSPFASPNQAGYGAMGTQAAFGPQAQAWSSNRSPTIQ